MAITRAARYRGTKPTCGWIADFRFLCFINLLSFLAFYLTLPLFSGVASNQGDSLFAGFSMGAFTLSATIVRPWIGSLIDAKGRTRMLKLGLLIQLAASSCYLLCDIGWVSLIPRFVHGIGWGVWSTALNAAAADLAPPERRGEYLGYLGMVANLTVSIGPASGIALAHSLGGSWVLGAAALAGTLALALSVRVSEPARQPRLPSRHTPRGKGYMLPALVAFTIAVGYGVVLAHSLAFGESLGMHNPGIFFVVLGILLVAIQPLAGRLSDLRGRYIVAAVFTALCSIGLVVLGTAGSALGFLAAATVFGLGMGGSDPVLLSMAVDRSNDAHGAAVATYIMLFDLGIVVGSVLGGIIAGLAGHRLAFLSMSLAPVPFIIRMALHRKLRPEP